MLKIKKIPKNLSNEEHQALYKLGLRADITKVARKTARAFDLEIEGEAPSLLDKKAPPFPFSAWLPLYVIREYLNWTDDDIAEMTSYPEMVMSGDWSGIRDSSTSQIWEIFKRFGKDALFERLCHRAARH